MLSMTKILTKKRDLNTQIKEKQKFVEILANPKLENVS